jgi:hypothetical protein
MCSIPWLGRRRVKPRRSLVTPREVIARGMLALGVAALLVGVPSTAAHADCTQDYKTSVTQNYHNPQTDTEGYVLHDYYATGEYIDCVV